MSVAAPCVLAIDLGTSGPKAAIVCLRRGALARERRTVTTLHLPDGGAEQDPEEIWRATRAACPAFRDARTRRCRC